MSLMLKEICREPEVLRSFWNNEKAGISQILSEIKSRDIRFAMLAARGTSDHAAIYGKYLLETLCGIPTGLADTSVYTIYGTRMRMDNVLAVGVSQSGEAIDVSEYLAQSRENGALTVAVTNCPGSRITQAADFTINLGAGPEKAVAATKTYTATLAAFYALSSSLGGASDIQADLELVANDVSGIIETQDQIRNLAIRFRYAQSAVVISRGYNYCTALETALKLTETSCIGVRGYSAADLLHGPIASVHQGDPCFVIAPRGPASTSIMETLGKLRDRGAEVVVFSSEQEYLDAGTLSLKLNTGVSEELSPMVYITAGQIFACHLSIERRLDPDSPNGLSKVTLTR